MRRYRHRSGLEILESRCLLTAVAPTVSVEFPEELDSQSGQPVLAPIHIDRVDGMRAAEVQLRYDTAMLDATIHSVQAGSIWPRGSTGVIAKVDDAAGSIVAWIFSAKSVDSASGSLLEVQFVTAADAGVGDNATLDFVGLRLNEGKIAADVVPLPGPDSTDGKIVVVAAASAEVPVVPEDCGGEESPCPLGTQDMARSATTESLEPLATADVAAVTVVPGTEGLEIELPGPIVADVNETAVADPLPLLASQEDLPPAPQPQPDGDDSHASLTLGVAGQSGDDSNSMTADLPPLADPSAEGITADLVPASNALNASVLADEPPAAVPADPSADEAILDNPAVRSISASTDSPAAELLTEHLVFPVENPLMQMADLSIATSIQEPSDLPVAEAAAAPSEPTTTEPVPDANVPAMAEGTCFTFEAVPSEPARQPDPEPARGEAAVVTLTEAGCGPLDADTASPAWQAPGPHVPVEPVRKVPAEPSPAVCDSGDRAPLHSAERARPASIAVERSLSRIPPPVSPSALHDRPRISVSEYLVGLLPPVKRPPAVDRLLENPHLSLFGW